MLTHYSHLKAYLDPAMPAMQVDLIIGAFELLLSVGIDGHDYAIEQEMALAENADTTIFTQSIHNLAVDCVLDTLDRLGVQLVENASLYDLYDVLRALTALDNYGDPDSVIAGCSNDEGPVIALADILPLVGRGSIGHYLHVLSSVTPALLTRVEEVASQQRVETPSEDAQAVLHARQRLHGYIAMAKAESLLIVDMVRSGVRLGMPLEAYLNDAVESLEAYLKDSEYALAAQLLGVLLASDVPDANLTAKGTAEIEALVTDINLVGNTTRAFLSLLNEMSL